MSGRVIPFYRGDNVVKDGQLTWLFAPCESTTTAYYCQTHPDAVLPNRHALAQHVKTDGDHLVCRWCARHGLEGCHKKPTTGDVIE